MADISIPGLSSKYNTTELVNGLVEVEKAKLTTMEDSVTELEDQKKIWQSFNRKISNLRSTSRTLFGFENPFSNKLVESSNERILTATATRDATEQSLSFTVLQTAQADKFISPSLPASQRVPAGNYSFEVGGKEFNLRYRGGKLSDFANRLEAKANGLLKLTVVKDTSDTQVILFESSKTGMNNRLIFKEDALSWALENNILQPSPAGRTEINLDPSGLSVKSEAVLSPESRLEIKLPSSAAVEEGMFLEYTVTVNELDPESFVPDPPPEPVLPDAASAVFEGIEVKSFGSKADTPPWSPPPAPEVIEDSSSGYLTTASGEEALPPLPSGSTTTEVRIPLNDAQGMISAVTLENNNNFKEVTISNMRINDPRSSGGYTAVNSLSTAGNAIIDFNGIKVERETNSIDDLIPSVTLNLNRADKNEEVEIDVKPDVESAKDEIIKFVYNYNQVMTQILILSSDNSDIINEIEYFTDEEREKAFEELGTFRGDITMMQLKNRLQRITSSPYATSLERELSMLSQIGVSTNAGSGGGGSVNASKLRGYLEINEDVLDQALQTKSSGIKELFGKDTDGDLVVDSGVGYELDRFLNPYIQTGGILSNKISLLDNRISDAEDKIEDYKEYLVDYEQSLKVKYGSMEGMLNQLESSSSSLDTFNQQNNR
ncbi:MAG: flagellar filament capping protein FliD [Spirochaetales bacterium]|nr:flagellar filament capping protein FliD [Spirochaetales bacterium]